MALLEILKFPDARLRETSKAVAKFDSDLKKFSEDLIETMYAENGIGLAAPQVGVLKRMLVVDTRPKDFKSHHEKKEQTELESKITQPLIVINPTIIKSEGKEVYEEGCLSVPSFHEQVERKKIVALKYYDLEGKEQTLTTDGLLAVCLQHEMDHLEGTLFIDHLSFLKANKIKNQIKKHGYPEKKTEKESKKKRETDKVEL